MFQRNRLNSFAMAPQNALVDFLSRVMAKTQMRPMRIRLSLTMLSSEAMAFSVIN